MHELDNNCVAYKAISNTDDECDNWKLSYRIHMQCHDIRINPCHLGYIASCTNSSVETYSYVQYNGSTVAFELGSRSRSSVLNFCYVNKFDIEHLLHEPNSKATVNPKLVMYTESSGSICANIHNS